MRCNLAYCPQIWRPHLVQDSRAIERLQRRATKYIIAADMDYKSRLANLSLLPLTLWLEFLDILLLIKLLQNPPDNFNISNFIVPASSRESSRLNLKPVNAQVPRLNSTRHYYFNRVIRLWNTLPLLDLELSITTLKKKIHSTFWDYFTTNYCNISLVHGIFVAHALLALHRRHMYPSGVIICHLSTKIAKARCNLLFQYFTVNESSITLSSVRFVSSKSS